MNFLFNEETLRDLNFIGKSLEDLRNDLKLELEREIKPKELKIS